MNPVLGNKVTHCRLVFESEMMVIVCMVGWVKVPLELHNWLSRRNDPGMAPRNF